MALRAVEILDVRRTRFPLAAACITFPRLAAASMEAARNNLPPTVRDPTRPADPTLARLMIGHLLWLTARRRTLPIRFRLRLDQMSA